MTNAEKLLVRQHSKCLHSWFRSGFGIRNSFVIGYFVIRH